jgi:DNA-binding CsgD family transcriptional regulator
VELAKRGLSNHDIAAARGVSVRTVAGQLSSAYAKLGVHSRRELKAQRSGSEALAAPIRPVVTRRLTPREAEALSLVYQGCSNKAIAAALGCSISTVSTLLTRARRKSVARAGAAPEAQRGAIQRVAISSRAGDRESGAEPD